MRVHGRCLMMLVLTDLAPLSDGRIDKRGRLHCAYHGWCFNGYGDCKLIPQAAPDGPPMLS
ncbi:hypothetical protein Dsin_029685 [Dipteronia sinensis]|uniref:Rieske domain-containing protein n=1 Tax=Dipteronia sinensis TaxID=43782 RepID=A0AAD9ZTJ4_9ROSI|nr:hypothetical protein Dsin_029685 [Dipteronia sinensis]